MKWGRGMIWCTGIYRSQAMPGSTFCTGSNSTIYLQKQISIGICTQNIIWWYNAISRGRHFQVSTWVPNACLNIDLDVSTVRMWQSCQCPPGSQLWHLSHPLWPVLLSAVRLLCFVEIFCIGREKNHAWCLQMKFRTGSSSGLHHAKCIFQPVTCTAGKGQSF